MKWVKLAAAYYLDPALAAAGERAELLFVRALAWCGHVGSPGRIPAHVVPNLLSRSAQPVANLLRLGLWVAEPDGYRVRSWDAWQAELSGLEARKRADRDRKARQRARDRSRDNSRDVTGGDQTRGEETRGEERTTTAAAAAVVVPQPHLDEDALPAPVGDLRRALDAAGLVVRWDRLPSTAGPDLAALVDTHGVDRLVRAAQASHRPDRPAVFAQAWLGYWRALPEPGSRLRVVRERCEVHLCDEPCRGCAADRLAVGE